MYQFKKHFTLEEARAYLPRLRFQISELIKLKEFLDQIGFDIYVQKYYPGFNPDTLYEYPDEYVQLSDILRTLAEENIFVKEIEDGLVDFPAIRDNGEEVFLCWKNNESDISFWHSLSAGYRGRRPIENF